MPLCEAVDQERVADIPKRLQEFIAADRGLISGTMSEALTHELAARMIKVGLEAESLTLRRHYDDRSRFAPGFDPAVTPRRVEFFTRLVDYTVGLVDSSTRETVLQSLELLVRAYIPLRNALSEIDWDQLAAERRMGLHQQLMTRPWMSRTEYADQLTGLATKLFTAIETSFQSLVETAAAELAAGSGSTTLGLARTFLDKRLRPAVFDKPNVASLPLKITRTTIKKGGQGRGEDMFATGAEARRRSVVVSTYDPAQEQAQELEVSVATLVAIRERQLLTLARIYGATDVIPRDRDFGGVLSDEARRNADAIKALEGGRLRLHSDDDWRAFVLQKFQDLTAPRGALLKQSEAQAFRSIVDLLFAYLTAFTVHARFTNVYDIGDSYLNRDFPRALSGQLVHDCGVYALRVAYILSRVRTELDLRFRFVVLPAHIALVIDGGKIPTYIVHNDTFEEISKDDMTKWRKDWEQFAEKTDVTNAEGVTTSVEQQPKGPRDETQFIGELTGATQIMGPLDMPFVVVDIPKSPDDAKSAQRKLWALYQQASTTKVFGSASDKKGNNAHLFHTRYLALTERLREIHNTALLPFWNDAAPPLWKALERQMAGTDRRTSIPAGELADKLEHHRDAYTTAYAAVRARLESLHAEERAISELMRNEPGLRRQGVRLGYGPRAATLWGYKTSAYLHEVGAFVDELRKKPGQQVDISAVRDRLKPPFIETRLSVLE